MKLQDGREMGFFNPTILVGDNAGVQDDEGCLSFPNLWLKVPRSDKITAMYLDNTGKRCIIELEGMDSRCFQHELDHLDGITFTEYVSDLKLQMARKKQRKINGRTK
jgi:peptide deformylase